MTLLTLLLSATTANAEPVREIYSTREARYERQAAAQNDGALQEAQALLKSREEREAVIATDPKAQAAAAQARTIAPNSASEEAMYGVASGVLESFVKKTGGDPAKMQKLAEDAKRDPARFYESLSDEQKAQVKSIADQIERRSPSDRPTRH
jgi:hypothetical protein